MKQISIHAQPRPLDQLKKEHTKDCRVSRLLLPRLQTVERAELVRQRSRPHSKSSSASGFAEQAKVHEH